MLKRLRFIHVFTLVIVAVVCWVVYTVMTMPDYTDSDLRIQVTSAMLLAFAGVVGYWVGTSNGSARKTEIMSQEKQP